MSREEKLTLAHPLVQAAKIEWESKPHRLALGFNQLFKRFKDEKKTHTEVAKEAHCSRQYVEQIYDRHFKRFCGNKTREERQRSHIPYRHRLKLFYARRVALKSKCLKPVVQAARKARCKVELVPMQGTVCQIKITRIRINGHLCSIHHLRNALKMSPKGKLLHTSVAISKSTLKEVAYVIFHLQVPEWPERFFVVPARTIRRKYGATGERGNFRLFIPLWDQPVYKNLVPKINFFEYENKWPKKGQPAS